jgi:hypothetical protein
MSRLKSLLATTALVASMGAASAADLPMAIKAPASPYTFTGYPFGSSGPYAGVLTEAGAGPVVASVPIAGVNPASLTTTTAGIGANFGYAWGSKGSMFAYAVEGKVIANNFNGANAGFSVSGPLSFEGTGLVWTPVSTIQTALSLINLPNPFNNIAPFPLLPTGVTASNVQAGFGAGFRADDMTVAFLGVGSNKVWSFSPKIEFDLMEQLSNGSAVREYVDLVFQNQSQTFGSAGIPVTAKPGTKYLAGVAVEF